MYRILTENKNTEATVKLVSEHFRNFTVIHAQGYWQGKAEDTLIIEVAGITQVPAVRLAQAIRKLNDQQTVLVQYIKTYETFVNF